MEGVDIVERIAGQQLDEVDDPHAVALLGDPMDPSEDGILVVGRGAIRTNSPRSASVTISFSIRWASLQASPRRRMTPSGHSDR